MSLLNAIKSLVIILLSILLVVDIITISILISSNKVLLNPETYIDEFERNNLYDKAVEIAVDMQFREKDVIEIEGLKTNITKVQAKSAVHKAFPRDWIKKQADSIIKNFISYIKGEQRELRLSINLKETKPNIANAILQLVNETLEKNINALIDGQTKGFAEENNLSCNTLYECRELCKKSTTDTCNMYIQMTTPENLDLFRKNLTTMFESIIKENVSNLLIEIPDEIDIARDLRDDNRIMIADEIRDKVILSSTITNVLCVIAVLLIISIAIIISNMRKAALYIGISFIISGIVGVILFYLLSCFLADTLDNIAKGPPEMEITRVIKDVIIPISTLVFKNAVIYATISGAIGIILIISYFIFLSKPRT